MTQSVSHASLESHSNASGIRTDNLRAKEGRRLDSPRVLKAEFPATESIRKLIWDTRLTIQRMLSGEDSRLLIVVGPCSIHDPEAALDYARRLVALKRELSPALEIVMRVYFEKPRTTVGWKGLINDPHMDDSGDVPTGLQRARRLLLQINELGLPAATEFLDPVVPQYIADLVSWAAIGARTTESQRHREMASGLSMPVGFKNGTEGGIQIALDAMQAASSPHHFLGIDEDGFSCVINTSGNQDCHLVLRGGRTGTNYHAEQVQAAVEKLKADGLPSAVMVDCSHANSNKLPGNQKIVLDALIQQRRNRESGIMGAMLESHLVEGHQKLDDPGQLKYGVSITDACIGWDETESILRKAADQV